VLGEQRAVEALEGLLDGFHLIDDVNAVGILFEHTLHAAHMPLDRPEPDEQFLFSRLARHSLRIMDLPPPPGVGVSISEKAFDMNAKTVYVPNIGCAGCIRAIENALREVPGVLNVKADLNTKRVTVEWNDQTNWDGIRAQLVEIDYPPEELISL